LNWRQSLHAPVAKVIRFIFYLACLWLSTPTKIVFSMTLHMIAINITISVTLHVEV